MLWPGAHTLPAGSHTSATMQARIEPANMEPLSVRMSRYTRPKGATHTDLHRQGSVSLNMHRLESNISLPYAKPKLHASGELD